MPFTLLATAGGATLPGRYGGGQEARVNPKWRAPP